MVFFYALVLDVLVSAASATRLLEERQGGTGGSNKPLIITNKCSDTIHPAILTQHGTGPDTGGFALTPGNTRTLSVGEAWQGRVWGRTNCSFNTAGTAPGGTTRNGQACGTGDCGGIINCRGTVCGNSECVLLKDPSLTCQQGVTPVSLAEFTLDTGNGQTFYDISLVDGYNLPMAIVLHPNANSSLDSIPPNLSNPSCVGTAGNAQAPNWDPYSSGQGNFLNTNASTPMPLENQLSVAKVGSWCPTNLEVSPLNRPSSGVYTYPDGNIQRPGFDPCYSACAKFGQARDCCTGSYDSPSSCQPSEYSRAAKAVCPDAYSYAFDDQTSTFIVPSGAGFEVIFCPGGRSTNILGTSKAQLLQLASSGHVSQHRLGFDVSKMVAQQVAPPYELHSPHGATNDLRLLQERPSGSAIVNRAVGGTSDGSDWAVESDSERTPEPASLPLGIDNSLSMTGKGSWRARSRGSAATSALVVVIAAAMSLV